MIKKNIIRKFTPSELNDYMQNEITKDFVIIDLRSPVKYRKNRLANAINIDYDNDNFEAGLEKLDRKVAYLVYCSWSAKSNIASEMMADLGFTKISKLIGGINAWHKEGFPLEHDE